MDKLGYKILNILKENGRETASDISKAIHLSASAILDRIKKMEEPGIIKGYAVKVDAKALGNDVTALMEVSPEYPRFHDSFMEAIMDHPNVLDCYYLAGDYDFVPRISCAFSDELGRIHRTIKSIPGISVTRIHFVLKEAESVYSAILEGEKERFQQHVPMGTLLKRRSHI